MGGHFHDIMAGTATPKAYEYSWNDDVIAMNQFAGVLADSTEAVSSALNTQTKGVPVVVYNPLSIAREDVVEAEVAFPGGMPKAVRVTGPDGAERPVAIVEWQGRVRRESAFNGICCVRCAARGVGDARAFRMLRFRAARTFGTPSKIRDIASASTGPATSQAFSINR